MNTVRQLPFIYDRRNATQWRPLQCCHTVGVRGALHKRCCQRMCQRLCLKWSRELCQTTSFARRANDDTFYRVCVLGVYILVSACVIVCLRASVRIYVRKTYDRTQQYYKSTCNLKPTIASAVIGKYTCAVQAHEDARMHLQAPARALGHTCEQRHLRNVTTMT